MDCFYEFCLFRQNETANPDNCDYLACKNRCEGTFAFSADCYIMDADEIAKITNNVKCWQCKYLMFSDCYGECSKGNISGIVQPHFSCGKGVIRNVDKSKD